MKLSVTPYSFHLHHYAGRMDVFTMIETIKYRYRLDAVDMWNPQMLSITDFDYLGKIKDALLRAGITVCNYAIDGANIWDPDPELRKRNADFYLENVKAAEFLGAKSVKVDTGSHYLPHYAYAWDYDPTVMSRNQNAFAANPDEKAVEENRYYSDEMLDYFRAKLGEYCERASDMGYDIVLENHWGPMLVASELVKVVKACSHPRLGILSHLGRWCGACAESAEETVAPYTKYIHIDRAAADTEFARKAKPYLDAGYDGYWGVEYTEENEDEFAIVEFILATAKRHLTPKTV